MDEANRGKAFGLESFGDNLGAFTGPLLVTVLFGLGNSSSSFLILRTRVVGVSLGLTVLIYAGYNLVAALISYPSRFQKGSATNNCVLVHSGSINEYDQWANGLRLSGDASTAAGFRCSRGFGDGGSSGNFSVLFSQSSASAGERRTLPRVQDRKEVHPSK